MSVKGKKVFLENVLFARFFSYLCPTNLKQFTIRIIPL